MTAPNNTSNLTTDTIKRIFQLQESNQYKIANTTARERRAKLKKLQVAIEETFIDDIKKAAYDDFKKHETEVELTEIFPIIGALKHAYKKLPKWTRYQRTPTPISFFGFSSKIKYEPKGVVLIIAPWNFAFNLCFMPLVHAIAAGNTVILKPSEHTPASSKVIKKIVNSIFEENEVAVIEGGIPETTHLLKQPFNHIFFTGAPSIGKIVMKAAAENLTSVSLELGGKSPAIIDQSADVKEAAKRMAWAKYMNNGQVCIAPDYTYIHESIKEDFIKAFKAQITKLFGENPQESSSYNRIVNSRHLNRLKSYLDDAVQRGGKIEAGGTVDEADQYFSPTVVSNLDNEALLWKEEIFGPILTIRTFKDITEPVDFIQKGEKPLALYIYSKNKKNITYIIDNTRAGGMMVNYSVVYFSNPHLPFGGSNNSGIGKTNGFFGFKSFSNAKAIQTQWLPINILEMLWPPYTDGKTRLTQWVRKWLS